jgi:transcriptional regulator with XRE-family HTH domain
MDGEKIRTRLPKLSSDAFLRTVVRMPPIDDEAQRSLAHPERLGDVLLPAPGGDDGELQRGDLAFHDTERPSSTDPCQYPCEISLEPVLMAPVDGELDPDEAARRLRAAIAYLNLSQDQAAEIIGVSKATLARMTKSKGNEFRPATWGQLWKLADVGGLPRAWFTADISRLHEVVPDEMPHFPGDTRWQAATDERAAALAREEQELRRAAQRSSARQQDGRSTKRAPRRRRREDA